jgi:hypothetical protein
MTDGKNYKAIPQLRTQPQPQPQPQPRRRRRRLLRRRNWLCAVLVALIVTCLSPSVVPPSPDWSAFASRQGHVIQALILTAHPDDECMFFSPTILSLVKQDVHVRALCLSSGMLSCLAAVYANIFILSPHTMSNRQAMPLVSEPFVPES